MLFASPSSVFLSLSRWSVLTLCFFGSACNSSGNEVIVGSGGASSAGGSNSSGGAGPSSGGGSSSGGSSGATSTGGASSDGGAGPTGGAESGGSTSSGGMDGTGGDGSGGSGEDFFGDSRCEAAGLLLCDGFEADSIDTNLWNVSKSGQNTVELTTEQAARGGQSIHIVADNGYGYIVNQSIFPIANNDYYGRMFLRVKRFSMVDWAHWTVAEGAGTGNSSKIRVGGQWVDTGGGAWLNRWGVGTDGGETGDWTLHDADPADAVQEPVIDDWVCLEWQHAGSLNETRFYLDGVEHPSLHTTAQDHGGNSGEYVLPNMTSFWFGWTQYQSDPEPFEVWIDEVALDDERIGCSN